MARFFTQTLLPLSILWLWVPGPAQAQPSTLGLEFQVNQQTAGYQTSADVAFVTDGFFIVWEDESSHRLVSRRFSSDGLPSGDERQVTTALPSLPLSPSVGRLPMEQFLVVWQSPDGAMPGDLDGSAIAAGRLLDDGQPAGAAFQINATTAGDQSSPRLAVGSGSALVAWTSASSPADDTSGTSILGRALSADGTPLAADFQINASTPGDQNAVVVTPSGDDFVVLWRDTGTNRLVSRHLESGSPVGAEHEIASGAAISAPAISALPDGLLAVWRDGAADSLEARFLDGAGAPQGGAFQVSSPGLPSPREPAIAPLDMGFVIVWTGFGGVQDADDAILGRLFDPEGRALGEVFEVNSFTTETQYRPRVASRDERFVVTWTTRGGTGSDTDYAIAGQLMERSLLFADGFESGNLDAWSSAAP